MNKTSILLGILALTAAGHAFSQDKGLRDLPRIERGQLVNAQPGYKREPMPIEKVVTKIITSPVAPTVVHGQPGIKVQGTFK